MRRRGCAGSGRVLATEIHIARSDRRKDPPSKRQLGPIKAGERTEAIARYRRGIETLWCDASHHTPSGRAAIAVVRARDCEVLVQKVIAGGTNGSIQAERFAVTEAFGAARRELERPTVTSVLVFSDAIGKLQPPEGVTLKLRSRRFNLAHRIAKHALDRARAKC